MDKKIIINNNIIYRDGCPIYAFNGDSTLYDIRNKKNELLGYIVKLNLSLGGKKYLAITDDKLYQRTSSKIAIDLIEGVLKKDYKELIERID